MTEGITQAYFRFYADLNELLAIDRQRRLVVYSLNGPVSVKHCIESLGVPHTEVALILANSQPVRFGYAVQPGDYLSIYPAFHELGLEAGQLLQPPPPFPSRFILDNHLGRLAVTLRLLGFDAIYRNDFDDEELAFQSSESGRILLTRDRRLLMRKVVVFGYCVRTRDPQQQLVDVLRRYRLAGQISPWRRCLRCNGELHPVDKETIIDRLEPKTKKHFDSFQMCQECQQIYWKGSHYRPLQEFIDQIRLQL